MLATLAAVLPRSPLALRGSQQEAAGTSGTCQRCHHSLVAAALRATSTLLHQHAWRSRKDIGCTWRLTQLHSYLLWLHLLLLLLLLLLLRLLARRWRRQRCSRRRLAGRHGNHCTASLAAISAVAPAAAREVPGLLAAGTREATLHLQIQAATSIVLGASRPGLWQVPSEARAERTTHAEGIGAAASAAAPVIDPSQTTSLLRRIGAT